ncbi:hypothetical protein ACFLSJ_01090 [Verrucomicrobiota bacterium]
MEPVSGMSTRKSPELTPEARDAIRWFVIKLVTPTGLLLLGVSFLLGFGIKDVAVRHAEMSAVLKIQEPAQEAMMDLTRDIAETRAKADRIIQESESLLDEFETMNAALRAKQDAAVRTFERAEAQSAALQQRIDETAPKLTELERIAATVKTWEGFQETDDIVNSVVETLRSDPSLLLARETTLRQQVDEYLNSLPPSISAAGGTPADPNSKLDEKPVHYYKEYEQGFRARGITLYDFLTMDEENQLIHLGDAQQEQWKMEDKRTTERSPD